MNKLKFILIALASTLMLNSANATSVIPNDQLAMQETLNSFNLPTTGKPFSINDLLTLTPKKYKELTGKKMTLKQIVQLKVAQKVIKAKIRKANGGGDIPQVVYIILAFLGWAWLLMGIMDDWSGKNWWLSLILYCLCWLPGFIYSMVHMKDYY